MGISEGQLSVLRVTIVVRGCLTHQNPTIEFLGRVAPVRGDLGHRKGASDRQNIKIVYTSDISRSTVGRLQAGSKAYRTKFLKRPRCKIMVIVNSIVVHYCKADAAYVRLSSDKLRKNGGRGNHCTR